MINLKKIGVTALAGSLAMFAANADMVITGGAEATYSTSEGTKGTAAGSTTSASSSVTGSPIGMSHDINFIGTGELDNGWTYTAKTNIAGQTPGSQDSTYLTLDMGALGAISIDQGSGGWGIGSLENKVPTAYEEADHSVGTLAHGIDATSGTNVLGYKNTYAGVLLNLEIQPSVGSTTVATAGSPTGAGGTASNYNWALSGDVPGVDGLNLAVGHSVTKSSVALQKDLTEVTGAINYTMGPVRVGYQQSEVNNGGAAGQKNTAYGIAFNVNENFSISYSVNDAELTSASLAHVTEESTGYQAAYSMGAASVRLAMNDADNVAGIKGRTQENTELSLALAF
jgi:outer membrane protein OmpU